MKDLASLRVMQFLKEKELIPIKNLFNLTRTFKSLDPLSLLQARNLLLPAVRNGGVILLSGSIRSLALVSHFQAKRFLGSTIGKRLSHFQHLKKSVTHLIHTRENKIYYEKRQKNSQAEYLNLQNRSSILSNSMEHSSQTNLSTVLTESSQRNLLSKKTHPTMVHGRILICQRKVCTNSLEERRTQSTLKRWNRTLSNSTIAT